MVLINPEVTDEALTAEIDQVGGFITSTGAEVTYLKRDTPWGRRRLAYPIQGHRDATYVLYQFLGSPSVLSDIERELKLDERVIRYLLVRQENMHVAEEEAPSEGEAEAAPAAEPSVEEPNENGDDSEDEGESNEDDETDEAE